MAPGPCAGHITSRIVREFPQLDFTYTNIASMSRASQITLATTCATAIGVVAFVHFSQQADKAVSSPSRHKTWKLTFI